MNHSMIEVVFRVHAEVQFGEEIRVSGNVPALGCDNPERSIPLVTTPRDFPWWYSKEGIFLPGDKDVVRYRYCIFSGGKFNRWEAGGKLFRPLSLANAENDIKCTEDKYGEASLQQSIPRSPNKIIETRSMKAEKYMSWGKKSIDNNEIDESDCVIVVSYFLPVTLSRTDNGQWVGNWDKENILSLQLQSRTIWVGSVRYANQPIPLEEEENVTRVLNEMNCYPVFINHATHFQFYDVYCKQNLWLIMHQIADVYGPLNQVDLSAKAQQNLWIVCNTVTKLFRDKILEVFQQGYMVWIHGFHLMLLPQFIRRRIPTARIGYYFHTPFPSSEIWRTMSRREDLLRGILGADQIGFHLFEYARHFLTVCRRLLGCSYEMNAAGMMTINVDGREVVITCIHVGVDLPRLDEIFHQSYFLSDAQSFRERFPGKIIVAGIDRLERLKGIPLKLMAIDQFMDNNPKWVGKIVFAMVGISAAERGQDYRQTQHDVTVLVQRLNAKYGGDLVHFEERHERDMRLFQRLVFFAASDILMITATRDGLNRYPMEFTLARKRIGELNPHPKTPRLEGQGLPGQGLIIISEFISSARVMRGALAVNPWRVEEVTEALRHALEMKDTERNQRSRKNLEFSNRLTTVNWATHVLHDLKSVPKSENPNTSYTLGLGMQYKVMTLKAGFQPLDVKSVCSSYRAARCRLILLDWGGTLIANSDNDSMRTYAMAQGHAAREAPTSEIKNIIETLCSDHKNFVFLLSGKELTHVSEFFGSYKGLGLGAEHGFYYRWPRDDPATADKPASKAKWQTMTELGDQTWKESAKLVMDVFVQRTHGTYIEQKGNALIWQFRDADPEFGFLQSKELEEHLASVLAPYNVAVIRGGGVSDGYIEVRPKDVSKGHFLDYALGMLKSANNEADFILAIGDDNSDEPMFERISRLQELQMSQQSHHHIATYGVTVGKKPSAANSYLDDPSAVIELLGTLNKCTQREKKFFSAVDLPSQAKDNLSGFASMAITRQQSLQQPSPVGTFGTKQGTFSNQMPSPVAQFGQMAASPGGHSLMSRAMSAGNLTMAKNESFSRKSIVHNDSKLGTTVELSYSEDEADRGGHSLKRQGSTLNEYMASIMSDNNKEDDDGGIFF